MRANRKHQVAIRGLHFPVFSRCRLISAQPLCTLHDTDYVLVGQEYIAQYRLCTCGTKVHCTIQTMYLWDGSTLHHTDYILVGRGYTAPYRLYTCGTQVHCTIQTVNPWERVHCTIQTKHLWDRSTLHHTDYALVGQRYTAPYRLCTCGTLVHCTT